MLFFLGALSEALRSSCFDLIVQRLKPNNQFRTQRRCIAPQSRQRPARLASLKPRNGGLRGAYMRGDTVLRHVCGRTRADQSTRKREFGFERIVFGNRSWVFALFCERFLDRNKLLQYLSSFAFHKAL
jgi:hypothetical protein